MRNGQLLAIPLLTSPTMSYMLTTSYSRRSSPCLILIACCSMNSVGSWASILNCAPCQSAAVQFVQNQRSWVCPSRHGCSCSSNYGLKWSKDMGSRWLPSTRVCADGEPKVWYPRYPMPGCGEAEIRKVLARNSGFDAKDELCQEVFRRISDLCGIPAAAVHFNEFMVSELQSWRRGEQQSVKLSGPHSSELFRIRSKESCSNNFHHHLFQCSWRPLPSFQWHGHHCSQARPCGAFPQLRGWVAAGSQAFAAHYGIYFENLPKRVLVMGVLANQTPQFQGTPPSTEALIYCAGTQRDPLFHDAPSYDCYKTPVPPNDGKPKPELVLTLELICSETNILVNGRNMAGELLCKLNLAPAMTLGIARSHIQYGADPSLSYNIIWALPGGQLLSMEHDSLTWATCPNSKARHLVPTSHSLQRPAPQMKSLHGMLALDPVAR